VTMALLALAAAYFLGAIPFGYLLVRLKTGADVRQSGSGNIGATNVLRSTGLAAGLATLLLDAGKGWFAVWLMDRATGRDLAWMSAAAFVVMLGHVFPVFLRLKGGKAVATFFGAWFYVTPIPAAAVLIVFLVTVMFSRFVSMGSMAAAATFPFGVWMIERPESFIVLMAAAAAALVVWRHKENLRRLRAGTEKGLRFGRKR
jgi:acyl phosphate:glycerol-3-phosphate acyltransferase